MHRYEHLTLRELEWAAEAKISQAWDHTALMWATLANCHRDVKQKRKPFQMADVHPFARQRVAAPEAGIEILKVLIGDGNGVRRN